MTLIEVAPAELLDHSDTALREMLFLQPDEIGQDGALDAYCAAARARAEAYTRQRFITRNVTLHLDGFGCGGIELPIAPVASVVSVKYIDTAGVQQTLSTDDYQLSVAERPNALYPAYGKTWPTTRAVPDSVEIALSVGYGASPAAVPADILQAVRWFAAHLFTNRDVVEDPMRLPGPVADMLDPHRVWL